MKSCLRLAQHLEAITLKEQGSTVTLDKNLVWQIVFELERKGARTVNTNVDLETVTQKTETIKQ